MAQLLAPYNNSMRLGQGFNSYTQQICLDQAVLPETKANKAREAKKITELQTKKAQEAGSGTVGNDGVTPNTSKDGNVVADAGAQEDNMFEPSPPQQPQLDPDAPLVQPWVKPQIVSYSSRFVERISDVTDSMNISGALSIKTKTIGGKANGSYVDSDKFKSSDINFHLQVRVTNQLHDATNYNIFNKLDIHENRFTEVYGDSFISGWEEGGELNAIISVKVLDKANINIIKAGIEAEMTTPALAGKVEANLDMQKSNLSKSTETTITVNWSGGGSIKDPEDDWTMATLKRAAAAFPEYVAITPQRTFAILTKYTALESFHKQQDNFSPLDYENAGIYTGSLLDHYMDYKALWKQITSATHELENKRATIDLGEPSQEMVDSAKIQELPVFVQKTDADRAREESTKSSSSGSNGYEAIEHDGQTRSISSTPSSAALEKATSSPGVQIPIFRPTFAGLIQARKVCRSEMSKIVREVDYVAKDPGLAAENRDAYFLHPLVFRQLLPLVRYLSPENAALGIRDPSAALLLGYEAPRIEQRNLPPVYNLRTTFANHALPIRNSLGAVAYRARDYTIQGCAGLVTDADLHTQSQLFNDLQQLDQTYRPTRFSFWAEPGRLQGIQTVYANGRTLTQGTTQGKPTHDLILDPDGSEVVTEVRVQEAVNGKNVSHILSLSIATSFLQTQDTSVFDKQPGQDTQTSTSSEATKPETSPAETTEDKDEYTIKYLTWKKPDDPRYSLRGFFGLHYDNKIVTLALVWGKDGFVPIPTTGIQQPLCKNILGLSEMLQSSMKGYLKAYAGKLITGAYIDTAAPRKVKGSDLNALTSSANPSSTTFFNALSKIDITWKIAGLGFATVNRKLTGLKVRYHNGTTLIHGNYPTSGIKWEPDVKSDLCMVKITAGSLGPTGPSYIDTLEFIRTPEESTDPWPMDLSTLRFLGEDDQRVSDNKVQMIEAAPKIGYDKYSVRGFFGECKDGIITKLGVIWGNC